jgi:hypothetical protein
MRDYTKMILFGSALLIIGVSFVIIGSEIPTIKTDKGFIITKDSIRYMGVGVIIIIGSLVSFAKSTDQDLVNTSSKESQT